VPITSPLIVLGPAFGHLILGRLHLSRSPQPCVLIRREPQVNRLICRLAGLIHGGELSSLLAVQSLCYQKEHFRWQCERVED
jgi:hypothetical protein